MSKPVYIVDEMAIVVDRVSTKLSQKLGGPVFYMYGHPVEIVQRLQVMTNSPTLQNKKYPLIALFTDIPIDVSEVGIYGTATMQMVIATITQSNYQAEERTEKSFKPILHPIYHMLMQEIYEHKQFNFEYQNPDHTAIDRYYWGKQGLYGNTGNQFNDYIDAIEIKDLTVPIRNQFCSIPNNI